MSNLYFCRAGTTCLTSIAAEPEPHVLPLLLHYTLLDVVGGSSVGSVILVMFLIGVLVGVVVVYRQETSDHNRKLTSQV